MTRPRPLLLIILPVALGLLGLVTASLLPADEPAETQPAEKHDKPDWARQIYRPGSDNGRDPEPQDAQTEPRWQGHSAGKPYTVSLRPRALVLETGGEGEPAAGKRSWKLIFDKPVEAFTIEAVVAVEKLTGKTFAASMFLLDAEGNLANLEIGPEHMLLSGEETWTTGDYTQPARIRITCDASKRPAVVNVYLDGDPKPAQTSDVLQGPVKTFCFGDSSSSDGLNGRTVWQSIAWTTRAALAPAGKDANPSEDDGAKKKSNARLGPATAAGSVTGSYAGPVVVERRGADEVLLRDVRDSPDRLEFTVEADGPVSVHLVPERFAITPGQSYWVNTSYYPPRVVVADQPGRLTLPMDTPRNCNVRIEPAHGRNILANGSFEQSADAGPTGWILAGSKDTNVPTLDFGHERFDADDQPATPLPENVHAARFDSRARSGKQSLRLIRTARSGQLRMTSGAFAILPGQTYLLEGFYHVRSAEYGAAVQLAVELVDSAGRVRKRYRDSYANPLRYTLPEQWLRTFTRFKAPADCSRARVVITARGAPSDICWDDLALRLAPTPLMQSHRHVHPRNQTPVLSREEVRRMLARRDPWQVRIDRSGQIARVLVDDQPLPLLAFTAGPYRWRDHYRGTHRDFAEVGLHFHTLPIRLGRPGKNGAYGPAIWLGPGQYDFTSVGEKIEELLMRDPEAKIRLYLGMDPYYAFGTEHPESNWTNPQGNWSIGNKEHGRSVDKGKLPPSEGYNFSYTAEAFRRELTETMRRLGEYLANEPAGKAIIGVHMVCGSDGQWFPQTWPAHMDRSPGALAAYREWLKRRYGSDEALATAWGQPGLTCATANFVTEEHRRPDHFFLDPAKGTDRRVIDANRFASLGVAETINLAAGAFKKGFGRTCLVTTYYSDILHNHGLAHWALGELVRNDDLDGIVSVMDYGRWRDVGRTGSYNSLAATLRLHGKVFLTEMDYRSDYSWLPADAQSTRRNWGVPRGAQPLAHQLRRDLGMALCLHGGGWLYGLGGNTWASDVMMDHVAEGLRAARRAAENPQTDDRGQIAVFCDERLTDHATRRDIFGLALAMVGHNMARIPLSRSGLSWDPYLLSDVDHPDLPDYRVMIFLSSPTITAEQIDHIRRRFQRDGRVLVFMHAAGMTHGFSQNVRVLSGIAVRYDPSREIVCRYDPAETDDPLAAGLGRQLTELRGPMFVVDDPDATVLATYARTEIPAAAVKRHDDWTGVYLAAPGGLSPTFLRALAGEANLKPIGPAGDATYAGNGFIVLHAITPDTAKTLRWSEPADLLDLTTGQIVARNAMSFAFDLPIGQTRWFRKLPPSSSLAGSAQPQTQGDAP